MPKIGTLEKLFAAPQYKFFKTMRTYTSVGGGGCGYSSGLMFCMNADSSDRLCSANGDIYGCFAGPVNYP
jgi:hypothetical protein